jgi:hypothetical protein
MRYVVVNEFKGCNFYDVYLTNGKDTLDFKQGISFLEADRKIAEYILNYNAEKIVNVVFDEEEREVYRDEKTAEEFLSYQF